MTGCPTHRAFCDVWASSPREGIEITINSADLYSDHLSKRMLSEPATAFDALGAHLLPAQAREDTRLKP